MLQKESHKRISAKDALNHLWFRDIKVTIDEPIAFYERSSEINLLKKAVYKIFVNNMDEKKLLPYQESFIA